MPYISQSGEPLCQMGRHGFMHLRGSFTALKLTLPLLFVGATWRRPIRGDLVPGRQPFL